MLQQPKMPDMIPSCSFPPMPCSFFLLPIPTSALTAFLFAHSVPVTLASSINTAETQAPPLLPRTFAQLFTLLRPFHSAQTTFPLDTGKATQRSFSIHSPKTVLLKLQPELPALPHTQPHHLALSFFFLALIIYYYMCIWTEEPSRLQSMGHKELDTTE